MSDTPITRLTHTVGTTLLPVVKKMKKTFSNAAFTAFMTTYRAWAKTNQAVPAEPTNHDCFTMTVTAVEDLAPNLRRITCKAKEFATLPISGPDEYFGLVIPPKGKQLVLPSATNENIRGALNDIDEELRPTLRWYTIRHLNRTESTMAFDVVTHGHSGPGSSWALDATVGRTVGYRTISATYVPHTGHQLLVADSTALPALHAILESFTDDVLSRARVAITITSDDVAESTLETYKDSLASLDVVYATVDDAPHKVCEILNANGPFRIDYAWLCGEANLAKATRRLLVKDWGVEKTTVMFSGYWRKDRSHG